MGMSGQKRVANSQYHLRERVGRKQYISMSINALPLNLAQCLDTLVSNAGDGSLMDASGERRIWLTRGFWQALQASTIQSLAGNHGKSVLYAIGRYWGERSFPGLQHRFTGQSVGAGKGDPKGKRALIKACDALWSEGGWGHCDLVYVYGLTLVTFYHSPVALNLEPAPEPVDWVIAGMLAGVFSVFEGIRLEAVEICCRASGAEYCQFIIGSEETAARVRKLLVPGMSHPDLLQRLRDDTSGMRDEL